MRKSVKIRMDGRGDLAAGGGASGGSSVLVLRPNSGVSGDMLVAGLAHLAGVGDGGLARLCGSIGVAGLERAVRLESRSVSGVSGVGLVVELPAEQAHRRMGEIAAIVGASGLSESAKGLALGAFEILARAEGEVHGVLPEAVSFHEVGALDSIVDVCLAAALFDMIAPARFVCGPLPLCDGVAASAHGPLFTPAPAVLRMLDGVAVTGLASVGETVTPTAISLLKAFGAEFGGWPDMVVSDRVVVYGSRLLPGVPNGAVFALGKGG